ncbi:Transmembrane protein [Mycobacterium colombiense]
MDVFRRTMRVASDAIEASVAAAGAAGGAAVNGVVGGVRGAVEGAQRGLSSGSRSVPAAALTVAVVGAVGLVEWPVLLPVGATVLGVHYLKDRSGRERKYASTRGAGSRAAAKDSSGSRWSTRGTAARSRRGRSAHD